MSAASELWLDYRLVDVFTDTRYTGNPLAVVLGGDALADAGLTPGEISAAMQRVANEFNLSETTFPVAPTAGAAREGAAYRLRIFTASTELPFAGHPSVGSAWVMRELGRVGNGQVVQECGAGLLPLDVSGDAVTLTGGRPMLGDPVPAAEALDGVSLAAADLAGDDVRDAGVGLGFRYLHVRPDAVARAVARPDRLDVMPGGGLSVFSVERTPSGLDVHARVFAGTVGPTEDPATGSAALGLGVWLAASGYAPAGVTPYTVRQGLELGRPSLLECTVTCADGQVSATSVTGRVVAVGEGRIQVR